MLSGRRVTHKSTYYVKSFISSSGQERQEKPSRECLPRRKAGQGTGKGQENMLE